MEEPYKLILWGLGKEYNSHVMCLKHQESLNEIRINAVTANEIPHYSRIDGAGFSIFHILHGADILGC